MTDKNSNNEAAFEKGQTQAPQPEGHAGAVQPQPIPAPPGPMPGFNGIVNGKQGL